MDAYSISYTSASRNSSRIWQDLKTCRTHSIVELDSDQMSEAHSIASKLGKRRARDHGRKPHIGIVGAGLAGLRCTDILLKHGFQVTIIEGRNRLGGRVHQEKLPSGHLIDLGPNWIHGTNDNPILDIAKETKTTVGSWDTRSYVFNEDGKLLALADGEIYSSIMWDIIQEAFAHSNKNSATISPDESLWDFFKKEVIRRIPESKPDFEKKREFVFQMAETWGAFIGSPIFNQSLKFFWLEECIDGENLFCAGTYQNILQSIAKPAVDGAHIKYATKATRIKTTHDDGENVTVFTEGGEALEFDEVVFTAPLGWLKRHPEAFSPALPSRLNNAIKSIGYGCLEKVYIGFPKAFWLVPDAHGRIVQGFCQWLAPKYASDSNPDKWNQEVVELASLSPATSQPTLLFYMYGDQSHYITHQVAKLSTKEKKDAFLYDFFKPYYSRLPQYDESSPDCQPLGTFSTEWLHDEFAGNGSYANFQVGLEEGDKDIAAMREGLPNRGLWFAGEHTAPFVALGTATGAYWSGESVGRRIAQAYGREKSGGAVAE
ncbi:flavin-containing amine oxidoreductase [Xylariales sp. AK1849]|nr:flavin-containing amine oxidoreductase [Xylariales sp. AK1849]